MASYPQRVRELGGQAQVLIAMQFAVNASTFTSFPLTSVMLANAGHSGVLIGTVLTVILVTAKGLPLVSGHLIDQIGARLFLSGGLFLRAAGFLALAFAQDATALVVAAAMIGTGSAAYETAAYGELARRPTRDRKFLFLVNNQALNLGVILGPALGALLLVFDIRTTFLASAGLFCFGALVARMAIRTSPPSREGARIAWAQPLIGVFRDRRFVLLCVLTTPWWIVFAQLYTSFPLYWLSLTGEVDRAQDIFIANGIAGLVFSLALLRLIDRVGEIELILGSYAVLGLLFVAAPWLTVPAAFVVFVVVYTGAETVLLTASDTETANIARKGAEATYFGASQIAWIVGGTIGNFVGAMPADGLAFATLWIAMVAVCGLGILASLVYRAAARACAVPRI